MKPGVAPEQPFAKPGAQVFNAIADVRGVNVDMGSTAPAFFEHAPRRPPTAQSIQLKDLTKAPPEVRAMFDVPDGAVTWRWNHLRQLGSKKESDPSKLKRPNLLPKRYVHQQATDRSDVSVRLRAGLGSLTRADTSDDFASNPAVQDREALRLEKMIDVMGVANSPQSTDDNTGRLTVDNFVNRTLVNTGKDFIPAGAKIAARIPRPNELGLGYIQDASQPVLWTVPVDPAKWDLNQRAHFVERATYHFDRAGNAEDKPSEPIRIGAAVFRAIRRFRDSNANATTLEIINAAEAVLQKHALGAAPYDVAVVAVILGFFLAHFDATMPNAEVKAISDRILDAERTFNIVARFQLWGLRTLIEGHDHLLVGRALTSAMSGQELHAHINTL